MRVAAGREVRHKERAVTIERSVGGITVTGAERTGPDLLDKTGQCGHWELTPSVSFQDCWSDLAPGEGLRVG